MLETLADYAAGALEPQPQEETQVSLAPKLKKEDGTVRFDQPAERVRCRVHGLTPWPGCTVHVNDAPLRILRVEVAGGDEHPAGAPGTIREDGLVACDPGAVRLLSVQAPGGRPMSYLDYARGHAVLPNSRMHAL